MNPKTFALTQRVLKNETNEWRYKKAEIVQQINKLEEKKYALNQQVFTKRSEDVFTINDAEFSSFVAKRTIQINQEIQILYQKLEKIEAELLASIREEKKVEILSDAIAKEKKKQKNIAIENYNDFISTTKYIASLKKII